jgi:hypothetical protein
MIIIIRIIIIVILPFKSNLWLLFKINDIFLKFLNYDINYNKNKNISNTNNINHHKNKYISNTNNNIFNINIKMIYNTNNNINNNNKPIQV